MSSQFGYPCEYCTGTVQERTVAREAFKHRAGFVILEAVPVGICDNCGNRYYSADTLKRVSAIASGEASAERMERIPVAAAQS